MKLRHYTLELFPYAPLGELLTRRCGIDELTSLASVARELMLRRPAFGSDAMAGTEWGSLVLAFHRVEETAAVVTWFGSQGETERDKPFAGNYSAYSVLLSGLSASADSAALGLLRDNIECTETLYDRITQCPRPAAVHVYLNPLIRQETIICSAADAISHAFFALLGAEQEA